MTRRVIFPPADYWTQPKETRVNINPANAGDLRRAGVFIKHFAHDNRDGMNAILIEALEAQRASQFIDGILATYDAIVPQLVTPAGQRAMVEMVLAIPDNPNYDEDCWRAARFLIAHGNQDRDGMNQIMHETENVSPTIIGLLDVYASILPTLHTPFGMEMIERGIRTLSGMEVEREQ